jgi:hypothetical protein
MKKSKDLLGFVGLGVGVFAVVRGVRSALKKGDKLALVDAIARGVMVTTSSALLIRKLRARSADVTAQEAGA